MEICEYKGCPVPPGPRDVTPAKEEDSGSARMFVAAGETCDPDI